MGVARRTGRRAEEKPSKSKKTGGCQDATNTEFSKTSQSKVEAPSGKVQ